MKMDINKDKLVKLAIKLADNDVKPIKLAVEKRIAYIVSHGASYASNGYAIRTQRVAKSLKNSGNDVLCFVRPGRPWELSSDSTSMVSPEMEVEGVKYIHSRWDNDNYKISETEHLERSVAQFCELFRVYRPEKVIAGSNWKVALPAWAAAKAMDIPFAYEIRGFWELSKAARKPGYEETKSYHNERIRDTFIAQRADRVFTLSNTMKDELLARGVEHSKIQVVYNGVDTLPGRRESDQALRKKLNISSDDTVIGYIGSVSAYEGLDELVTACEQLISARHNIKLLLVGDEQPVDNLLAKPEQSNDKPWLIKVGRVPHSAIPEYYDLIDTIVIPRKKLRVCEIVPPMKAVEAAAFNKKLVVSNLPVLREITSGFNCVHYFDVDDIASLKEAILNSVQAEISQVSETELSSLCMLDTAVMADWRLASKVPSKRQVTISKSPANDAFSPNIILNSSNPTWQTFKANGADRLTVIGGVQYFNTVANEARKAVLLIKVSDDSGNDISKQLKGLAYSSHLKSRFIYLNCADSESKTLLELQLPKKCHEVVVGVCAFNHKDSEYVEVNNLHVHFDNNKKSESAVKLSSTNPVWFEFSVSELVPHTLQVPLSFTDERDRHGKAVIAIVKYYGEQGNELAPPYQGMPVSKKVGAFTYIDGCSDGVAKLIPPKGAVKVTVGLQRWNAKKDISLASDVQCTSDIDSRSRHVPKQVGSALINQQPPKLLSEVKVAAILDEFTLECFRMEVDLTALSPETWREQLDKSPPDILFVESCWFGNGNQWGGLIYGYTSNGPNKMDVLIEVLNYCHQKAIPTVFWSKEDPVHYTRFGPTAKLFDFVYTTDANMVQGYKKDFGIDAEPLSFFCQPKVHNPVELIPRQHKAAFAGSYYGDKKERCDNFHSIMEGLELAGVDYDIYDRCLKRGVAHLQFPEHYKNHVVGYLEPDEMWKAYKGYRYTVNLNTVKHSPTMFARRVYESLASGTPVISNYSEGVITQFSGIVCASDNQSDILDFVKQLEDPKEYQRIAELGVRETLSRHTLADRLEQICKRVNIAVKPHLPLVNAVITAATKEDVEKARAMVKGQTYHDKRLVVNLENSNELYPYLNINSDSEVFRVKTEFAKPLDGVVVEMQLNETYPNTKLEDAAIKTQFQGDELRVKKESEQ